jgi:hypothetical protein
MAELANTLAVEDTERRVDEQPSRVADSTRLKQIRFGNVHLDKTEADRIARIFIHLYTVLNDFGQVPLN